MGQVDVGMAPFLQGTPSNFCHGLFKVQIGWPPVNVIPTKIGSKMGGEFTYPQMVAFDPQPYD